MNIGQGQDTPKNVDTTETTEPCLNREPWVMARRTEGAGNVPSSEHVTVSKIYTKAINIDMHHDIKDT